MRTENLSRSNTLCRFRPRISISSTGHVIRATTGEPLQSLFDVETGVACLLRANCFDIVKTIIFSLRTTLSFRSMPDKQILQLRTHRIACNGLRLFGRYNGRLTLPLVTSAKKSRPRSQRLVCRGRLFQNGDASGLRESRYARTPKVERPRYGDSPRCFAMPCFQPA